MTPLKTVILLRKLTLYRALTLRLGLAWPKKLRAAGIPLTDRQLCDSNLWNSHFDALENYARAYGYTCPLDDLGPLTSYIERAKKVLAADSQLAKSTQNPAEATTAGTLENVANSPANVIPLADAMCKAFGFAPLPRNLVPKPTTISTTKQSSVSPEDKLAGAAVIKLASLGFPADAADLRAQLDKAALREKERKRKAAARERKVRALARKDDPNFKPRPRSTKRKRLA